MKDRNVLLTGLEIGKSNIKALAGSASGEDLFSIDDIIYLSWQKGLKREKTLCFIIDKQKSKQGWMWLKSLL
jgi:hypothetical protein